MKTTIGKVGRNNWAWEVWSAPHGRPPARMIGGGHCRTKKAAINDARIFCDSREPKPEVLFVTSPHGAQRVARAEAADGHTVRNQLFKIEEVGTSDCLTLTGEEMDSLCQEWIQFRLTDA